MPFFPRYLPLVSICHVYVTKRHSQSPTNALNWPFGPSKIWLKFGQLYPFTFLWTTWHLLSVHSIGDKSVIAGGPTSDTPTDPLFLLTARPQWGGVYMERWSHIRPVAPFNIYRADWKQPSTAFGCFHWGGSQVSSSSDPVDRWQMFYVA